jgi:dihydroxyacetone kinase
MSDFRLTEVSRNKGMKLEILFVDDNISIINTNELYEVNDQIIFNKRRGIWGSVLVHKILGELSRRAEKIDEIIKTVEKLLNVFIYYLAKSEYFRHPFHGK